MRENYAAVVYRQEKDCKRWVRTFLCDIAELKYLQASLFKTYTFGSNISVCLIESQIKGVKKDRDQL